MYNTGISGGILKTFCVMAVFATVFAALPSQADENWPQFRGAESRGVAEGEGPPARWSATENVEWSTDIPGRGWSSPIVWGSQVFLTTVVNSGVTEEPKKGLYC